MRYTLLTTKDQKSLGREYTIRLLVVFCFLLSLAGIIGSVSLFPSFIQAYLEEREERSAIVALKKDNDKSGINEIQDELRKDMQYVKILSEESDHVRFSALIQGVVSLRQNVRLSSLTLSRTSTTTVTVSIQGLAPTRDSLIAFKSRLENLTPGNQVDLPISELAKSRDIVFNMRVSALVP